MDHGFDTAALRPDVEVDGDHGLVQLPGAHGEEPVGQAQAPLAVVALVDVLLVTVAVPVLRRRGVVLQKLPYVPS